MNLHNKLIAIIGLGYVGLPLAIEFGKIRHVIGYDIESQRISQLQSGEDTTLECSQAELSQANLLRFSSKQSDLQQAEIFIVTVPTPVDKSKNPDMAHLISASVIVAKALKKGALVIYESTVYPGATEEFCVPILEEYSGLKFNQDFFCGYSPERINPGDKEHRLPTIKKVTSGSTPDAADAVDELYAQIITAGTFKASSIKVAEAAKVIENTQRDVNIALMNEFSIIFQRLGIDTLEVLKAAGTKWNFSPFLPGLVGGHCIGVDSYYLTYKAMQVGYLPEVILSGRRLNESMPKLVAESTVKLMLQKSIPILNSRILVLGLTFKENCPDFRNTKVLDLVKALQEFSMQVDIYDPWIDVMKVQDIFGLRCMQHPPEPGTYDAIVLAVAHKQFVMLGENGIKAWGRTGVVVFDVKGILPLGAADGRL